MRAIGNIIWIVFGGLIAAVGWVLVGLLFYVTIAGIPLGRISFHMAAPMLAPFGVQLFKMAKLLPFGSSIEGA